MHNFFITNNEMFLKVLTVSFTNESTLKKPSKKVFFLSKMIFPTPFSFGSSKKVVLVLP